MKAPILSSMKDIVAQAIPLALKLRSAEKNGELSRGVGDDSISIDEFVSADEAFKAVQRMTKDPDYVALKAYLDSLSLEEAVALMTIMYIGRDYSREEVTEPEKIYAECFAQFATDKKEAVVRQMISKIPLGEYLQDGTKYLF